MNAFTAGETNVSVGRSDKWTEIRFRAVEMNYQTWTVRGVAVLQEQRHRAIRVKILIMQDRSLAGRFDESRCRITAVRNASGIDSLGIVLLHDVGKMTGGMNDIVFQWIQCTTVFDLFLPYLQCWVKQ